MKTESDVYAALCERHQPPEWAILRGVRNGTGYQRTTRTADALAMSLWPSRGLEVHGFEIKVARQDWLKEKKDPAKAEEIARYCDRWWIVAGEPTLVLQGELPPTWGLLVPKGNKLVAKVEAPKLEAQPVDRRFLASIFRCLHASAPERAVIESAVTAAVEAERKRSEEVEESRREMHKRAIERHYDQLKESVAKFEAASGVKIDHWNGEEIGQAVKLVLEHGVTDTWIKFRELAETAEKIAVGIRQAMGR